MLNAPSLLRSAGVRFAIVYAVLLTLSATALAIFLWWETAGLLDRQSEAAIRADAQGLVERWEEGGLPPLVLTIDDRLAQNVDDDAIYLVVDSKLRRISGNLDHWPDIVTTANTWHELPVQRAGVRSLARVQSFDLLGGYRLLVGRDVKARAQLRSLLTDALLYSLAVVIGLGVIGAVVVRNLLRRTLANVSATATAIAAGDLTQRVKLSGRGDEFDQLSDTINVMLDRITRLMDGVRQVSNAIAHDLRTPITRARTRLEDAALHATSADELHAAIERATGDLDDIVGVFQALLRISEIEAGARRSAFEQIDACSLLTDIDELYSAVLEERGMRLELTMAPALPCYGNSALIQQAVTNLLDNAMKFSPPGGIVSLSGQIVGDLVEITVADHGPGIPEPEMARATERFFRGDTARNTPGSGLGLSLVQAVAQLHGGALVLSDNRPGLRAALQVPLSSEPVRAPSRQTAAPIALVESSPVLADPK